MKSNSLLLVFLFVFAGSLQSQVLFSYAGKEVTTGEYVKAFDKVHTAPMNDRSKKIREYLDLYINSKLKTHEAAVRGYDTLPGFIEEFAALRGQVVENYMQDEESLNKLVKEAFDRSQKDIRVQHIFIPFTATENFSDSAVAKLKAQEAFMELSSGKNFDDVALKFSADPSVADNKGNLGYLTVFSLPYRFENIIYGLAPGKFSAPVKSNSGYHIFKNNSERKAAGKMKAMQILLVLPPGSEPDTRKKIGALADSLYHRLQKGDDFSMLATTFSNDIVSAASGGQMAEFGLGTYDPVFESAAFALPANGAVSKPFLTSHGYHIVKRISLTAPSAANDKKTTELLRSQVERDSRINEAREILYKKILDKAGYKPGNLNLQQVKIFTDSAWEFKPAAPNSPIHNTDILFTIGNKPRTVSDLIGYGHSNRANPDGSGVKSFNQVMEDFKRQATMDYYRDHLEDYNPAFEQQMKELKEGNLFFDIMMKEVWSKSQSDSAGMAAYFENNKTKYVWKNSAAAVIFYCGDEASAGELKKALTNNPADWKMVAEGFSSQVTFDSARFEINKIPGLKNTTPKPGLITAVETNKDDNSASFAYIIKLYNQPAQKTLAEAKSELVTDFQDDIDRKWADELRKKYNLKINTAAQNTLK